MANWPVRREASLLVGDQPTDLAAAAAAGIASVHFGGGNLHDFIAPRLAALGEPDRQDDHDDER